MAWPTHIIVPDPTRAEKAAERLLQDLKADGHGKLAGATSMLTSVFDAAEKRMLSRLLDLNPDLRLTTPDGVDVTHLYAKTTKTGA